MKFRLLMVFGALVASLGLAFMARAAEPAAGSKDVVAPDASNELVMYYDAPALDPDYQYNDSYYIAVHKVDGTCTTQRIFAKDLDDAMAIAKRGNGEESHLEDMTGPYKANIEGLEGYNDKVCPLF